MEKDKLYWSKKSSGHYTVKSAYRTLQAQKELWSMTDNSNLWKKVWCIKSPPKALNLLRRALSSCLPTNKMLQQKQVAVLGSCPVCEGGNETIFHSLVSCPLPGSVGYRRAQVWL